MAFRNALFYFAFLTLVALAPTSEAKVGVGFQRKLQQTSSLVGNPLALVATVANFAGQLSECALSGLQLQYNNGVASAVGLLTCVIINTDQTVVGTVTNLNVSLPVLQVLGACNVVNVLIGAPLGALTAVLDGNPLSTVQIVINSAMVQVKAVEGTTSCIVSGTLFSLLGTLQPVFQLLGGLLSILTSTQSTQLGQAFSLVNTLLGAV